MLTREQLGSGVQAHRAQRGLTPVAPRLLPLGNTGERYCASRTNQHLEVTCSVVCSNLALTPTQKRKEPMITHRLNFAVFLQSLHQVKS